MLYLYKCKVLQVIDGDTISLDIDLGRGIHAQDTDRGHRLWGINAPEIRTVAGKLSKQGLESLLGMDFNGRFPNQFFVYTVQRDKNDKRDKYGRYLAVLFDHQPSDTEIAGIVEAVKAESLVPLSLNTKLVESGLAVEKYW